MEEKLAKIANFKYNAQRILSKPKAWSFFSENIFHDIDYYLREFRFIDITMINPLIYLIV